MMESTILENDSILDEETNLISEDRVDFYNSPTFIAAKLPVVENFG